MLRPTTVRGLSRLASCPRPRTRAAVAPPSHPIVPRLKPQTRFTRPRNLPIRPFTTSASRPQATPSGGVTPLTPFRTRLPGPGTASSTPLVHTFYHEPTSTWTYLVVCPTTHRCAIIDSVLDYDPASHTVSTETADALIAFIHAQGLVVDRLLETHAHADHLTAAAYLQVRLSTTTATADAADDADDADVVGPRIMISIHRGIRSTQAHFAPLYDIPPTELEHAFDHLYDEGDELRIGDLRGVVWHLPGHTLCSAGFVFGDCVFTGDSVLLPPTGTARADFPLGSAPSLFASAQRLLALPAHVRLFSGHSYPLPGSSNLCSATVAQQRQLNPHVQPGVGEAEFVRMREERDQSLREPGLLHPALQVNLRAGRLPRNANGQPYFRTPIHAPAIP